MLDIASNYFYRGYYLTEINGVSTIVKQEYSRTNGSVTLKLLFRVNKELKFLIEQKKNDLSAAQKFINDFSSHFSKNE